MTDHRTGRRLLTNVLTLIGTGLGVVVLISLLGLLVPPAQPLAPPSAPDGMATCERPQPSVASPRVTSGVVHSCPEVFDGRVVTIRGEAIGDLLRGPDGRRWVQVNDDAYADAGPLASHHQPLGTNSGVAVLLPQGVTVPTLGGPGVRGDILQVVGTFAAAAPEDQGGPAVIASGVTVQRPGDVAPPSPSQALRIVTPIAVSITMILLAATWRRRIRR